MFQEVIAEWLERSVPDKGTNECYGMPFLLSSDVGLQRKENQDRVCAMAISSKSSNERPQIAVAVADGMGGMRDGAACADLTISNFFYGLALYKDLDLKKRVYDAVCLANKEVYRFSGSKGGATLSAFVIDRDCAPILVNLGDSRVYSYSPVGKVKRLTVDDSMKEAVGGYGNELVQFVGMGEGIRPSIVPVEKGDDFLAITTDGVHFIEKQVFDSMLTNAKDFKSAADRLTAVARWCGGHDNASIALIDVKAIKDKVLSDVDPGVRFWDSFGSLSTFWIRPDDNLRRKDLVDNKNKMEKNVRLSHGEAVESKKNQENDKRKTKRKSRGEREVKKNQLVIDIIANDAQGSSNED